MNDANERAIERYLTIEAYAKVGQIISGLTMLISACSFVCAPRGFTQGLEGLCCGVPIFIFALSSIVRAFSGGYADLTRQGIFNFNRPE